MANQDKFLATLQTAQMVYDPDLISASNGSLTTLGKKYLLAPKTLNTIASIEIPFNCSLGKMKKLAKFVFLNIFAASEDDTIGNDTVEDYYCGNKHYTGRFMLDFMENILLENFMQGGTVRLQSLKFFEEVCWPKHNINEIQKEKILNMEYQDIIDIFDDIDFSAIMNSIDEFLRANFEKTNISEVIINTDNLTYYGMFHHPGEHYRKNIRAYILDYCSDFHLNFLRKKLLECIRGLNCGYGKLHAFTDIFHPINGCLYKDFKMTELANKIGKPIVVDTTCSRASEPENHANLSLQETNAKHLIDIIQPYSYYAEVIVSKNCMLDMSLKQVIETTTTDGALEKSTLSVSDKSIQMDDFFCAICDNLWFSISIQDANLTITDYVYFKSKITAYVKTFLFGESKQTVDLDANVNFGPRLPCETYALNISPRTIMEIGIAPCLDTILSVIITSLKDKECFGRYQPTIAFISGDLLYQLIYESHPAYSKYIWMHLIATLASQTYVKQLKTNILLTKNYIYSHHSLGYTTLEWKKYQQVYKKSLFVKIEHIHGPEAQVYIDRGDYLENVPSNKIGSRDTWTIPLTKGKHDPVSQNGLKEAIYVHLKNFSTLTSKSSSERMLYDILFIYNNVEEEEQHEIIKNTQENVVMHALFTNDIYTDEENRKRSSFPLEILVLPFNDVSAINLYSGMGLDMLSDSYQTYNSVSIPERLTVKRI